jgi:hypothetical protein
MSLRTSTRVITLFASMLIAPIAAGDARIVELEREVRELRQLLREHRQIIDRLEQHASGDRSAHARAAPEHVPQPNAVPRWVSSERWELVHAGMSALQAVEILGPPTSYREFDDRGEPVRRLFYALEIGPDGFLAGHVDIRDGNVSTVEVPRLQ